LTDEQIADVVRPLAALPLWAELLGSAGFVESGPDRWLSPEGRKAELVADDHLRVALALTKALLGGVRRGPLPCGLVHEAGKLLALAQTVEL